MLPKKASSDGKKGEGQGKIAASQGKKAGTTSRRRIVTPSSLPPPPPRPTRNTSDIQRQIRNTPDAQGPPWWLDHDSRQQPRAVRTYTELSQARLHRAGDTRTVLESADDPQVRAQLGSPLTGRGSTAYNPGRLKKHRHLATTNNYLVPIHQATELKRLAPGTWVIYQGTENGWVPAWGVWPVFPPPNRVWHSWSQGAPAWRPRVQSDGPPGYDWEDYRDYIDLWGLPEHFQNNRRNGVVNHHGNINSELEIDD